MPILVKIYLIILSVSFFSGLLVLFGKTDFRYLRLFAPFLFLTLIVETTINFFLGGNNKVYNIFFVIEFNFYFLILAQFTRNKTFKKIIKIAIPIFTILSIINFIFIQGITYVTYNTNLGAALIVIFCIYCFSEIFKAKAFIFRNPAFWICTGLLIFYACTFPIWAGIHVMLSIPPEELVILGDILSLANWILYSCFTVALLLGAFPPKSRA